MDKESIKRKVNVFLTVREADTGKVLETRSIHNIVVDTGLERLARLANGVDTIYFQDIAIGTGVTAETAGDIALETEFTRQLATLTYEAGYISKFETTFSFASGVSEAITEIGVFDSGSVMMNRATFSAINIDSSKTLTATIKLTASR